jgi:hypothetical protein
MIDLETLSNSSEGALLSIAAVAFDRDAGDLGPTFQQNVSLQDCIDRGMKVDAGTIDWWMEKPVEVWQSVRENDVPLPAALRNLNTFIDQGLQESHRTWAKGSDFEFGLMLRPAYDLTEVDPFWDFPPRNFRCLRTLEVEDSVKPEIPHDPLSDAKAQAKDVINHYN